MAELLDHDQYPRSSLQPIPVPQPCQIRSLQSDYAKSASRIGQVRLAAPAESAARGTSSYCRNSRSALAGGTAMGPLDLLRGFAPGIAQQLPRNPWIAAANPSPFWPFDPAAYEGSDVADPMLMPDRSGGSISPEPMLMLARPYAGDPPEP